MEIGVSISGSETKRNNILNETGTGQAGEDETVVEATPVYFKQMKRLGTSALKVW